MFMPSAAARQAMQHMQQLIENYQWLQAQSELVGEWYCPIKPKLHLVWHLADGSKFVNPRFTWTYKCESWVGKVSTIAASCAHGTRSSNLTVALAAKYRIMVGVNLWRLIFED